MGFVAISPVAKVTCGTAWSANLLYRMRGKEIITLNKSRYGGQSRSDSTSSPLIRENAERNVKLFEHVLKRIDEDVIP